MVTPLGVGKEAFGEALWRGETGIREIAAFPTEGLGSHLGAEVREFQPRDFISVKNLRKMDRLSAMTTASVRMALDDAGIAVIDAANRDRIGIVMGTAFGNTELKVQSARILFTEGPGMVNPIHVPNTVMNAPAGHASIELGFRGVNTTVNHQAVSAETAIAYGAMEIRRGAADVILAGGRGYPVALLLRGARPASVPSPRRTAARRAPGPSIAARNGPVMGEGCGIVCLEAGELGPGARGGALLRDVGLGARLLPVAADGLARRSPRISARPGARPPDGGCRRRRRSICIEAAANGGREPDAMEAAAYERLFGGGDARPLITALKGATGEIFASGGIRAAALALSLREGIVPPVVGLAEPLAPLPFVIGSAVQRSVRRALLSGISFGGTYACLVFER